MIDAVVNTSADFLAKNSKVTTSSNEVTQAVDNVSNTKTTKATEVESQAKAVNDKDFVQQSIIKKQQEKKLEKSEQEKKLEKEIDAEQREEAKELSKDMNDLVHGFGLSFALEDELNRTVVTVTDTNTEEVIRQIPSEEFIKLAKRISEARKEMSGEVSSADLHGLLCDSQA